MVKATFKNSSIYKLIFFVLIILFVFMLTLALTASIFFGSKIVKIDNYPIGIAVLNVVFFYTVIIIFIKSLIDSVYTINIDEINKTIFFKSLITFRSKLYSFEEFDSYYDIITSGRAGEYKEIHLITKVKTERIITGQFYSNLDEIQQALTSIRYNGLQKKKMRISK
jgi:hypothetical protein